MNFVIVVVHLCGAEDRGARPPFVGPSFLESETLTTYAGNACGIRWSSRSKEGTCFSQTKVDLFIYLFFL